MMMFNPVVAWILSIQQFRIFSSCLDANIATGRSYNVNGANFSIVDCFFCRSQVYGDQGGVIYCYCPQHVANITNCMFFGCFAASNGGAISIYVRNSLMTQLCFNNCSSNGHGDAISSSTSFGDCFLLSSSECSHQENRNCVIAILLTTFVGFKQINVSKNGSPAIAIGGFSIDLNVSFSSFSSSIVDNNIFVIYYNVKCDHVSFINNKCGTHCIYLEANSSFDKSIFYNQSSTLFKFGGGNHLISNSFIFHKGTLFENTGGATYNFALNDYFVDEDYSFTFFSTHYCQTALTPYQIPPDPTPLKTQQSTLQITPLHTLFPTIEPTMIPSCQNSQIDGTRAYEISSSCQNFSINYCIFKRFQQFSGSGGVIKINCPASQVNITDSTFIGCFASLSGGAVEIGVDKSCFCRLCFNNCSSGHHGDSAYSLCNNGYFYLISSSECSLDSPKGSVFSFLMSTFTELQQMNISTNGSPAITFAFSIEMQTSYSTFSRIVNNDVTISLYQKTSFDHVSFINNKCGTHCIYLEANSSFDKSIFYNQSSTLFKFGGGNHLISNSFIFHKGTLFENTGGATYNFALNDYFVDEDYSFTFFSTHYCKTALTPYKFVPDPTLQYTPFPTFQGYIETDNKCKQTDISVGASYVNNQRLSILECSFNRMGALSGNGGVIYIRIRESYLSVVQCVFSFCVVDPDKYSQGGSIFFDSMLSGESFIKYVCAYEGQAFWGHFAVIGTSFTKYNVMEYVSVSTCGKGFVGFRPIFLFSGYQMHKNCNSSTNMASSVSGITIYSPSFSESLFCSFSNNKAKEEICLYLYNHTGFIKYSNIVHNDSPLSKGIIYVSGGQSETLSFCTFIGNTGTLFCSETKITFYSCLINHSYILAIGKVFAAGNNSELHVSTYSINHLNTGYCHADVPLSDLPKPSPQIIEECKINGIHVSGKKDVFISHCVFSNQFDKNAPIELKDFMSAELSHIMFYKCDSKNFGAIRMFCQQNSNSQAFITKICSFQTRLSDRSGAGFILSSDISIKFDLSSISDSKFVSSHQSLLYFRRGGVDINSLNITKTDPLVFPLVFETVGTMKFSTINQIPDHYTLMFIDFSNIFDRCNVICEPYISTSLFEYKSELPLFENCVVHLYSHDISTTGVVPGTVFKNCLISGDIKTNYNSVFQNVKITHATLLHHYYFNTAYCPTRNNVEDKKFSLKEDYFTLIAMSAMKVVLTGMLKCIGGN